MDIDKHFRPSGLELLRLVEANIISIPEARRMLLGPDASPYPSDGTPAAGGDVVAAIRRAVEVLNAAIAQAEARP